MRRARSARPSWLRRKGTASSFLGLSETIAAQGLLRAFYTDRGSHYFCTPKAGGKVDKSKPTQVGRDNCVNWKGLALQIPPQRHRHHYVTATVRVHEYPGGQLAIFDGPSCLARFTPYGKPIVVPQAA